MEGMIAKKREKNLIAMSLYTRRRSLAVLCVIG
jgi:hypothetical protein